VDVLFLLNKTLKLRITFILFQLKIRQSLINPNYATMALKDEKRARCDE